MGSCSRILTFCLIAWIIPAPAIELTEEQQLGALLYNDVNLSLHRNQSCASCHALSEIVTTTELKPGKVIQQRQPAIGFIDPDNIIHNTSVSSGSDKEKFGALNTPSAGYAAFSPFFHWDGAEGLYVGGQFWNGRANTLAEQAEDPPTNPVEMMMPNKWAVVSRLQENKHYIGQFKSLYHIDLADIPAYKSGSAEQIPPPGVLAAYNAMAMAIGEFEKSRLFNRFDSKFDFVMAKKTGFTEQEQRGFELFNGDKAKCSACHVTEMTIAPGGKQFPALLTDFTYDNLGVPRNQNIPGNPEPDLGLGGRDDIASRDPDGNEIGKHKVMSLRNIELTPPYMHNGAFRTLEQVVHFYNTRDTKQRTCADINDPGFGVDCWPAWELQHLVKEGKIKDTINYEELGNLGLTPEEESDLVTYMRTLTDNYPEWGNREGNSDPKIPPGTPSPYAEVPFPPFP